MIVREVNEETSEARTIVKNVDGTFSIFGKKTMASLVDNNKDLTENWVGSLTDRELRGLVAEVGHRVLCDSEQYQLHKKTWDTLAVKANFEYFGLSADATGRDLESAYKRLAKMMHPDKNGGTEEAKERFQHMKERYEALKAWFGTPGAQPDSERGEGGARGGDRAGASKRLTSGYGAGWEGSGDGTPQRREAYDEDDVAPEVQEDGAEQGGATDYDPTNRQSLQETVLRMLKHMKSLRRGLEEIKQQLGTANVQP